MLDRVLVFFYILAVDLTNGRFHNRAYQKGLALDLDLIVSCRAPFPPLVVPGFACDSKDIPMAAIRNHNKVMLIGFVVEGGSLYKGIGSAWQEGDQDRRQRRTEVDFASLLEGIALCVFLYDFNILELGEFVEMLIALFSGPKQGRKRMLKFLYNTDFFHVSTFLFPVFSDHRMGNSSAIFLP